MPDQRIQVDTYHEYMCEAFGAIRMALGIERRHRESREDSAVSHWELDDCGRLTRYGFLMAANGFEAAANALLLSLGTSHDLYDDLEKLPTLLRFEVFCMGSGQTLDRGDVRYARVRDVVRCRNEFVHPKPRLAPVVVTPDGSDVEICVSRTKSRDFPTYLGIVEPEHALQAAGDILAFLSWIVFDLCALTVKEGVYRLGVGSYSQTGSVIELGYEHRFDLRTFGEEQHKTPSRTKRSTGIAKPRRFRKP